MVKDRSGHALCVGCLAPLADDALRCADCASLHHPACFAISGCRQPEGRASAPAKEASPALAILLWVGVFELGALSIVPGFLELVSPDRLACLFLPALVAATAETTQWAATVRDFDLSAAAILNLWGVLPGLLACLMIAPRVFPGDSGFLLGFLCRVTLVPCAILAGLYGVTLGLRVLVYERRARRSAVILLAAALWPLLAVEAVGYAWPLYGDDQRRCWNVQQTVNRWLRSWKDRGNPAPQDLARVAADIKRELQLELPREGSFHLEVGGWTISCTNHSTPPDRYRQPSSGWERLWRALPGRSLTW